MFSLVLGCWIKSLLSVAFSLLISISANTVSRYQNCNVQQIVELNLCKLERQNSLQD